MIALISSAVAIENYHHESASYDSSHSGNYSVDGHKRRIAGLKAGTDKPYGSSQTVADAVAYEERELAKDLAEWKKTKQQDEDDYDAALIRLIITLIVTLLPCGAFVALRVKARKVPRYVDEDPALAGAAAGAPPGPGGPVVAGA